MGKPLSMWTRSGGTPSIGSSFLLRLVQARDGLEQAQGVWVPGSCKARVRLPFDDAAGVHDVHPVRIAGDHAEVVGDDDDGRTELAGQPVSSSRIWAWIVTSRAVVGSSARRSSGLQERAMAIITRWRMPPENWCDSRRCATRLRDADHLGAASMARAAWRLFGPSSGATPASRSTAGRW